MKPKREHLARLPFPRGLPRDTRAGTRGQASDGPPGSRHAPGGSRFTHAFYRRRTRSNADFNAERCGGLILTTNARNRGRWKSWESKGGGSRDGGGGLVPRIKRRVTAGWKERCRQDNRRLGGDRSIVISFRVSPLEYFSSFRFREESVFQSVFQFVKLIGNLFFLQRDSTNKKWIDLVFRNGFIHFESWEKLMYGR